MNTTKTLQPIPYLMFNGNCSEAVAFYAKILGGKVVSSMTFGQMPTEYGVPEGHKDKIVNVQLELPGGALLYGGDCGPGMGTDKMSGCMVALNFDSADEGETVFNRLSAGGEVTMPYAETFWSDKFGMFTDRFGIHWCVNGGLRPM